MDEKSALIAPMNKKGVLGLNTAKAFIILILTISVVAFATLIAIDALDNSKAATTGSIADNVTTSVFNNVSQGIDTLFGNTNTWFSLLAVTIIILIVAVVIVAVSRFGAVGGGGGL